MKINITLGNMDFEGTEHSDLSDLLKDISISFDLDLLEFLNSLKTSLFEYFEHIVESNTSIKPKSFSVIKVDPVEDDEITKRKTKENKNDKI